MRRRKKRQASRSRKRSSKQRKDGEASPKRQKIAKEKYVLWFSEVGKNDAGVVGGKGSNLGECAQAGMNVPPGFCITAGAFRLHMASCEIDLGLRDGQTNKDIAACILQQEIAATTSKEIIKAYKKLGSPMVAVRSSATAEDSASASFAGQLETYLGIMGQGELLLAIKECWASLFSERVAIDF